MSKNATVIRTNEFNPKTLEFTAPKLNKKKKLCAYINKDNKNVAFETPHGLAPFGVSFYDPDNSGKRSYSINISASGKNPVDNDAINAYYEKWVGFDNLMIDYGVKHSKAIFGKARSRESVSDAYSKVIKVDDEGEYPMRLSPKIKESYENQKATGKPDVKVFTKTDSGKYVQKHINSYDELVELVPKQSYVKAVIKPYVWFINKKFGVSMSVAQLLIEECEKNVLNECAFTLDDGSEIKVEEELDEKSEPNENENDNDNVEQNDNDNVEQAEQNDNDNAEKAEKAEQNDSVEQDDNGEPSDSDNESDDSD
jgi:hypothetical protein